MTEPLAVDTDAAAGRGREKGTPLFLLFQHRSSFTSVRCTWLSNANLFQLITFKKFPPRAGAMIHKYATAHTFPITRKQTQENTAVYHTAPCVIDGLSCPLRTIICRSLWAKKFLSQKNVITKSHIFRYKCNARRENAFRMKFSLYFLFKPRLAINYLGLTSRIT